jgi:hypothetical protein
MRDGQPQFSPNAGANFVPMPQDQILANKLRINILSGNLQVKADRVNARGQDAISKFAEYLNQDIPPCKPGSISGAAFDQITFGFFGVSGASAYQKCLDHRSKMQQAIVDGTNNFTEMGNIRADFYADYNELMQYAPTPEAWQELCAKKLAAENRFQELSRKVQDAANKALSKIQQEEAQQAAENSKIDELLALLQGFIAALQAMIEAVVRIFAEFLRGAAAALGFFAAHPTLIWVAGGLVGLAAVGFIARPYFKFATRT